MAVSLGRLNRKAVFCRFTTSSPPPTNGRRGSGILVPPNVGFRATFRLGNGRLGSRALVALNVQFWERI